MRIYAIAPLSLIADIEQVQNVKKSFTFR
jgi:hypothetical protein